ncbi:MAG TPA: hypothetical protein VGK74_02375 [Symbiobacteriaceae bacterium]|jgi:hypothetical protein
MNEYPFAIQSRQFIHAAKDSSITDDSYETACGKERFEGHVIRRDGWEIDCAECVKALAAAVTEEHKPLTINGLVEMAYGTATAAGWHDNGDTLITSDNAYFLIAGLTGVKLALSGVLEAIRKPQGDNLPVALEAFREASTSLLGWDGAGIMHSAMCAVGDEIDKPLAGSKTQMLAWLHLIDSESAEAMEAVLAGDKENFAEELVADIMIRVGDDIGAINDMPGHFLGPIDPEAVIRAKNAINEKRPIRHGGKRA